MYRFFDFTAYSLGYLKLNKWNRAWKFECQVVKINICKRVLQSNCEFSVLAKKPIQDVDTARCHRGIWSIIVLSLLKIQRLFYQISVVPRWRNGTSDNKSSCFIYKNSLLLRKSIDDSATLDTRTRLHKLSDLNHRDPLRVSGSFWRGCLSYGMNTILCVLVKSARAEIVAVYIRCMG